MTTSTKYPANTIHWYDIEGSSNVARVGYGSFNDMYVEYLNGGRYLYHGVPRQKVVACALAGSVGQYIAQEIKPHFEATRLP